MMSHAICTNGMGLSANLAQIHNNALVNLLPQVSSEDLNEGDFECGDLSMHEDSSQIQLHLKSNVDISSVDGRRPP